jgi:molybdenum cofactor guanylyltransferase
VTGGLAAGPGRVVAAIIAGGGGTRLGGRRKGDLEIGGRRILDRQLAVLRPLFTRILLVDNDPPSPPPTGVEVIGDRPPAGRGPLAGLDAVMSALHPDEDAAVCVAGDMPFLQTAVMALLRDHLAPAAALVPMVAGHPEPLCARYARPCARVIAAALTAGRLRTMGFLSDVDVEYLPEPALRALDPQLLTLENVNTPEDLARLDSLAGQSPSP